ncbi:hypothetical protein QAD02_005693 [Eretmocerus hayati]|uniref:Uncharacterized protein n=1 Tax=Eretmocerus hayati TaxID=131215 RepID=A0ACC2NUB5_9HYME|nr:hypothetical protein QAD02_005693 [Eretmocerus hayati]
MSKINPQQILTTDVEVHSTTLPWKLTKWSFTKDRIDVIRFNYVTVDKLSCRVNLALTLGSTPRHRRVHRESILEVELHGGRNSKSKFLVDVYMMNKKYNTPQIFGVYCSKAPWLAPCTLKFNLPPMISNASQPYMDYYADEDDNLTIYIDIKEYVESTKIEKNHQLPRWY